jgi:hypothetical protein
VEVEENNRGHEKRSDVIESYLEPDDGLKARRDSRARFYVKREARHRFRVELSRCKVRWGDVRSDVEPFCEGRVPLGLIKVPFLW